MKQDAALVQFLLIGVETVENPGRNQDPKSLNGRQISAGAFKARTGRQTLPGTVLSTKGE
jgi:hypothetical protein